MSYIEKCALLTGGLEVSFSIEFERVLCRCLSTLIMKKAK